MPAIRSGETDGSACMQCVPSGLPSANPEVAQALKQNWDSVELGPWPSSDKLPIVYGKEYNVRFIYLFCECPKQSVTLQQIH